MATRVLKARRDFGIYLENLDKNRNKTRPRIFVTVYVE
jgi:hypothetical protein